MLTTFWLNLNNSLVGVGLMFLCNSVHITKKLCNTNLRWSGVISIIPFVLLNFNKSVNLVIGLWLKLIVTFVIFFCKTFWFLISWVIHWWRSMFFIVSISFPLMMTRHFLADSVCDLVDSLNQILGQLFAVGVWALKETNSILWQLITSDEIKEKSIANTFTLLYLLLLEEKLLLRNKQDRYGPVSQDCCKVKATNA
jgi:hypothetical protein